jgi:hypothetical protein
MWSLHKQKEYPLAQPYPYSDSTWKSRGGIQPSLDQLIEAIHLGSSRFPLARMNSIMLY